METVEQYLKRTLTAESYNFFIQNLTRLDKNGFAESVLSGIKKGNPLAYFSWADTPQGFEYWAQIAISMTDKPASTDAP